MSDISGSGKSGPAVADDVSEVQGLFPSNATLEDAILRLTGDGFDRADISIPDVSPTRAEATPEQGAANPNTDVDDQQSRTLHTGLAASVGALAAAGAVVATGGLAAPAIAAAVAGGRRPRSGSGRHHPRGGPGGKQRARGSCDARRTRLVRDPPAAGPAGEGRSRDVEGRRDASHARHPDRADAAR